MHLFNFLTKIPGGLFHWRRGTVRRRVVVALALGSILGAAAVTHLRTLSGAGINEILRSMVGLLLISIALLLMARRFHSTVLSPGCPACSPVECL